MMPIIPLSAGQQQALKEELHQNAAVGCAQRFAQADLARALGDRDEHDVDDADCAEGKRDDSDAAEEDVHRGEDHADGALRFDGVPLFECVVRLGSKSVAVGR